MENSKETLIEQFKNWCKSPFSLDARKHHKANAWQTEMLETVLYPWLYPGSILTAFSSMKDVVVANGGFDVIRVSGYNAPSIWLASKDEIAEEDVFPLTKQEFADIKELFVNGCEGIKNVPH